MIVKVGLDRIIHIYITLIIQSSKLDQDKSHRDVKQICQKKYI